MPTAHDSPRHDHWLIERRLRVYPRIFLVMFVLAVPLYALTFEGGLDGRGRPMGTDFIAFWSAARMAVEGRGVQAWDLYELAAVQRGVFPGLSEATAWVHPPTMMLVVAPLGLLSYPVAFVAWTVAGLVAYVAALAPMVRRLPHAWPVLLAFPGLWLGVAHGQTQFVVTALFGGALLLLLPRPVLAGVLIGLLAMKPHLAVLIPVVLVAGRHWATFASAAASSVMFFAASVAVFGRESITGWFDGMNLVSTAVDVGALPVHKFVTPYAGLRTLGLGETPALLIHAVAALATIVVVWTIWRRTTDLRLRGSAAALGTFLVTPYAADYDLALLALPIAWLSLLAMEHGWNRGDRNALVVAWTLPWLAAPLAFTTHLTLAPLVVAFLLRQVWVRTATEHNRQAQSPDLSGRT